MKLGTLPALSLVPSLWSWQKDGVPIASGPGDQVDPRIAVAVSGDFYVAWKDPSPPYQVYVQLFGSDGRGRWPGPKPVCVSSGYQRFHSVVATPSGSVIAAFTDGRAGFNKDRAYASKIASSGGYQWKPEGVRLSTADVDQYDPKLCLDGTGEGCYVAWTDYRSGDADVWAARVTAEGQVAWEVPVCVSVGERYLSDILPSGDGALVLFWDYRVPMGLYAQRLVDSIPQWERRGKLVIANPNPAVLSPGTVRPAVSLSNGAQDYACSDERGGMYAFAYNRIQRVDSLGALFWDSMPRQELVGDAPYRLTMSSDSGAVGCDIGWTWTGFRRRVMAVKVVSDGALPWGAADTVWVSDVWDTTSVDYLTDIASDGRCGAVIALAPVTNRGDRDVRILRVDAGGHAIWEQAVCGNPGMQDNPVIVRDAQTGGYIVVWQDWRAGDADLYTQYADSLGNVGVGEAEPPVPVLEGPLAVVGANPHRGRVEFLCRGLADGVPEGLVLYDRSGRVVWRWSGQPAGSLANRRVVWDGRKAASGVYFAAMRTDREVYVRKVVMVK